MVSAINSLIENYPDLAVCREELMKACELLSHSFKQGGKTLICGNGGSAADSEHIVGELMKGFISKRPLPEAVRREFRHAFPEEGDFLADHLQGALPCISLLSQSSLISAFANDVSAETVYAQQVYGYGRKEDVLLAISTSGNSANVIRAVQVAKVLGMRSIGLSGAGGGKFLGLCDITIRAPRKLTHQIQEMHLPIYHALCMALEEEFFGPQAAARGETGPASRAETDANVGLAAGKPVARMEANARWDANAGTLDDNRRERAAKKAVPGGIAGKQGDKAKG